MEIQFAHQSPVKREFCRKCLMGCIPVVTLTFDNGARRLHWCAEHVEDAERYRPTSDQAPMTRVELAEWLAARGVEGWEAISAGITQHLGKTEDEMNAIYDETCGSMA